MISPRPKQRTLIMLSGLDTTYLRKIPTLILQVRYDWYDGHDAHDQT
jgi:hypothetical protein